MLADSPISSDFLCDGSAIKIGTSPTGGHFKRMSNEGIVGPTRGKGVSVTITRILVTIVTDSQLSFRTVRANP
jgi:hypothetical protein